MLRYFLFFIKDEVKPYVCRLSIYSGRKDRVVLRFFQQSRQTTLSPIEKKSLMPKLKIHGTILLDN